MKKLGEWSVVFGHRIRIIRDRGVAFTSNQFQEHVTQNEIGHVWNSTGMDRGNGQIERVYRIITSMVAKLSAEYPPKWYKVFASVQKAVNSNVLKSGDHKATTICGGEKAG